MLDARLARSAYVVYVADSMRKLVVFGACGALLLSACGRSKEDAKKELANQNVQLTADDLVRAVEEGNENLTALFLDAGIDPSASNSAGTTALITAATDNKPGIVKLLLQRHADPNGTDKDGQTALIAAAAGSFPDIVKLLLDAKADPAHQDHQGWTALLKAVYKGNAQSVQQLVEGSKADLDRGLLIAALLGYPEVVKILLEHGAEVDVRSDDGRTPLMLAASKGNQDLVAILLKAGADASLTDNHGETAGRIASSKGFVLIAQILQQRAGPGPSGSPSGSPPAVANTTPSPSSSPLSDEDILKMPTPSGSAQASPTAMVETNSPDSLSKKVSVVELDEDFLPVTLLEVKGKRATLKGADGETYSVGIGDEVHGLSYRVTDIEAREVNDKDGNQVDASIVKLRHVRTGQTISLIKGIPAREHGAYAVLAFGNGETVRVELDHDFKIPDDAKSSYRILDIRPTQVVVKRLDDNKVWTLEKTTR